MSDVDLGTTPLAVRTSPAERAAARLTVANNATDADDCRALLGCLGLLPAQDRLWLVTTPGGRAS